MKKLLFIISFLSILSISPSIAQCAMCKATVEGNLSSNESNIGAGLNKGILYLMTIPYILGGAIAIIWYRNSKRNAKKNKDGRNFKGKLPPMQEG